MAITMVFIFTQVFWIASKMETPEEAGSEEKD
jgi:hypothetical protein